MAEARRLFFALWPPAAVAERLHAAAQAAIATQRDGGGRVMKRETLHLTLAFLGAMPAARVAAAEALAASIDNPAFDLTLDQLGYWKHNRILWAGCVAPPAALATLAGALAEGLRREGFSLDARPFAPHATLLRDVRCRPEALPSLAPVFWPVDTFALVESTAAPGGSRYEVVARWPLAAGID